MTGGRTRYLVCVCADRHPKGSRQTKVGELDLALGVDEEVLGLQVSMKNSVGVAEGQALQELEKVTLQTHRRKKVNSEIKTPPLKTN